MLTNIKVDSCRANSYTTERTIGLVNNNTIDSDGFRWYLRFRFDSTGIAFNYTKETAVVYGSSTITNEEIVKAFYHD